ncbi:DnaJ domain-containing protein [Sandarakinorhabdus rubra]|uniref:DnaJ domain-containing protein n=1 Tax=Sandarakinorhabdus rubra TaxID=2672568 RepID=UPI0013D8ECA9|nr:DnaJ domain-containing protein [Sandarakinorhabdus rubra]
MNEDRSFVDYYAVLRVHPECDARTLEIAYRRLAKLYHPDHSDTADIDSFRAATEAYRALKDHGRRAAYDQRFSAHTGYVFANADSILAEERAALSDAEVHAETLMLLYKRRRERASDPGVGPYELQSQLACSDEAFDFHIWYLKSKGLIETTDAGTLAISIAGVDHVISESRVAASEKLRITQFGQGQRSWPREAVAA